MSVLEIDLKKIKDNIKTIKLHNNNQKFCFVAKCDAYGLGAKKICVGVDELVDMFAVASQKEFLQIYKKVSKPILILCPIYENITIYAKKKAIFTVSNKESFYKILKAAKRNLAVVFNIHIAINTGMNRFGFSEFEELVDIVECVKKTQNIYIIGVFSHYFAGNVKNIAKNQNSLFFKFKNKIQSIYTKNKIDYHIASSSGWRFSNDFDVIRIGIDCYLGAQNSCVKLTSKVVQIQNLNCGEVAGYSGVFVATKNSTLAIVAIGYGDGVPRSIQQKGYVLINNSKCKIVAICMDCLIVDVTHCLCKVGDEVTILGKNGDNEIFVCDMALWCDTISYEILTRFSKRIKRVYKKVEDADYNRKV